MKRFLLLLIFIISQAAYAETDDYSMRQVTSGLNPFSPIVDSRGVQNQYSAEQVKYNYVLSPIESFNGCQITKAVAEFPWGMHKLFPKEYECLGKENLINKDIHVGYLAQNAQFYGQIFALMIFVFITAAFFFVYHKMVQENNANSRQKAASYFMLACLTGILFFVCKPTYENDEGQKTHSFASIATMAVIAFAQETGNQYDRTVMSFGAMSYPLIDLIRNGSLKTDSWMNVAQYMICDSENMRAGGVTASKKLEFKYDDNGNYQAIAQHGVCGLDLSFRLNTRTALLAEQTGLNDYKAMTEAAMQKAIQKGMDTMSAIANKVVDRQRLLANASPNEFDPSRLSCDDPTAYNVNAMTNSGVSLYVQAASECVSKQFTNDLNAYPGITQDFYKKVKSKSVYLCAQDTYTQDSTSKYDDTPKMLSPDETTDVLEGRLKSCVNKMCGSDSSPFVCSAAIEYYAEMTGSRYILEPNVLTKASNFIVTQFDPKQYVNNGKLVFNSFKASYSDKVDSIITNESVNETAFAVSLVTKSSQDGLGTNRTSIDVPFYTNISVGEAWNGLTNQYTDGDDGLFGYLAVMDCMRNPEQLSPSGRNCGTVFNSINSFGNRLFTAGMNLIIGQKTSAMLSRTGADRAVDSATIGATKRALDGSNMLGSAAIVGALTTSGILESSGVDAYSQNDSSMTATVATIVGIIYAVPSMASMFGLLGSVLQTLGIFLIYIFPLFVIGMMVVFAVSIMVFAAEVMFKFWLYFILLFSNDNGVNETTDYFRVVDEIIEFYFTIVVFPIRFALTILFIKASFLFNLLDLDNLLGMPNSIIVENSFQNVWVIVGTFGIKIVLYVAYIWCLFLEPTRTRKYVHSMIFGKIKKYGKGDDDEFDETDEYRVNLKKAYSL
jgi:hypothetical protein